ncbi:MAG TPA: hypothetical protein VGD88_03325 [Opitutaceae bacterium]
MRLVFVHGWSVLNTDTYGGLPAALVRHAATAGLALETTHLHLGKYVSFADEVKVDDLARGLEAALAAEVIPHLAKGERFACITHSTGGPVVRAWIDLFHRARPERCPLGHLVMLAPANHGSALAQLGKGRLSRMKFFVGGVEPGTGVLDWLELGSEQSWALNARWLGLRLVKTGLYPFVLTGQKIDREFYDNLNAYTDESGTDGVVRVAAANLNYGLIRLVQTGDDRIEIAKDAHSERTALAVLPGRSHSGTRIGIMGSVSPLDDGSHPTVSAVLRCLQVASAASYARVVREFAALTADTQEKERRETVQQLFLVKRTFETDRYCMLVFRLHDDRGNELTDYDVLFTAGPTYNPNHLPPGFFVDRQRNQRHPGKLTYYMNYDRMVAGLQTPALQDKFGFEIVARPVAGFAHYRRLSYRGTLTTLKRFFEPNQTLMLEIQLRRWVDTGVVDLKTTLNAGDGVVDSPIGRKPTGKTI